MGPRFGKVGSYFPRVRLGHCLAARRSIVGSAIGGIAETQEMLDFCAERGIVADIETIRVQEIEEPFARMLRSDVKYRFVIDSASLSS